MSLNLDKMSDEAKGVLLLNYLNKYSTKAKDFFDGEYFKIGMKLQGSALINQIIDNQFIKEIMGINVLDVVKEEDIYTAVKNANGFNPSLFVC